MYKYLLFIIFGILLYLFLNSKDSFSVGIPVTDLNQIFPDSDDKITTDIDPYGTGIPRIFWNQGLRLRERFEPSRLYDVGWYYGNDSGRIFISAINIPILETIGTTGRPAIAEVLTPTYINYNMYRYQRELVINGITYYIGTAGRDIIGEYRLYNQDNALIIIDLNNNIVVDEPLDLLQLEPDHPPPQSAIGGATDGGACSVGINTKQKLMDSYKVCDPSITDDILSQLRCAFDSNKVDIYTICDPKEIRCHMAMGVFQDTWLNEIYNITEDIFRISDFTGWFEFGQYLNSGNHYLASLSTPPHSFLLEFKNKQFRILSSWEGVNSFLDFPSMSIWGNFDGHPNWDEFTRLMTILNGGPLLNPDGSKITTLPSDDSTWTWTEDQLRESGEIYNTLFSVPVNMQFYIGEVEPVWRRSSEFQAYPKGKVINELRVFIQINELK